MESPVKVRYTVKFEKIRTLIELYVNYVQQDDMFKNSNI